MKVKEEITPTDGSARPEIQEPRTLRKLDAEVAERVMGWTRHPEAMHPTDNRTIGGVLYCPPNLPWDCGSLNVVRNYSSGIAAAMEVVEKLRAEGWSFACTLYQDHLPYASFCKGTAASSKNAEAPTLPEAICRAALAAVSSPEPVSETVASLS